jgi:hypothetical protein
MRRVFLLSPAHCGGKRAQLVMRDGAAFELAVRLRTEGASLAEVFSFLSGLYFRGKVAYSRAFAAPGDARVIVAGRGLVPLDETITMSDLRAMAEVPIDLEEPRYREPMERAARELDGEVGPAREVVLLGSVATLKYVQPLLEVFGERLVFPEEFVGRGDMSRGGLMLRCARAGTELAYRPVAGAELRGRRPPKLA